LERKGRGGNAKAGEVDDDEYAECDDIDDVDIMTALRMLGMPPPVRRDYNDSDTSTS